MSFQEMYGLRGPWGSEAVLQLTYELRPKWQNNNKNKTQNAVSRSDPLQGSDNDYWHSSRKNDYHTYYYPDDNYGSYDDRILKP